MKATRILTATLALLVLIAGVYWWFARQAAPTTPAVPVAGAPAPDEENSVADDATLPTPVEPAIMPAAGQPAVAPALASVSEPTAAHMPVVTPQEAAPTTVTATPADPQLSAAETAATSRMYAAHASLRTPEVADPDSEANRQILTTMVAKALSQKPSLPPTRP